MVMNVRDDKEEESICYAAIECLTAVQGHPRSLLLVPSESMYATLLVINSNFVLTFHCF